MTVLRLVISEISKELDTLAPHTGEFESLSDAKRCADRRQNFISTDLVIKTEAGELISYRPGIRPWVDVMDFSPEPVDNVHHNEQR